MMSESTFPPIIPITPLPFTMNKTDESDAYYHYSDLYPSKRPSRGIVLTEKEKAKRNKKRKASEKQRRKR